METDNQLLERYARKGSEHAFGELVKRHINLVYSAAIRESRGDVSTAEDITQAVFTELARRATELIAHPALSGWLYTCVRRMTANLRRAEDRRQHREQETFNMNQLISSDPADNLWQQVWPELDDVLHELHEEDRTALVLRFFEGRNFREVGAALGLTENAARMRVERSLEKLRGLLSQRGVTSTASALAVVLTAGAATAAPSVLASTVTASALATAALSAPASVASGKLFTLTKTQFIAGVVLTAVVGVTVWRQVLINRSSQQSAEQTAPALAEAATSASAHEQSQDNTGILTQRTVIGSSQMLLHVVEPETGESLPHAKLYLAYFRQNGKTERVRLITDKNGKAAVDIFERPFDSLNLFVTADGHVPKVTSWGTRRPMPAQYTMRLERGVTIAGTVVDEAGQPIAGAKIEFDGPGNDWAVPDNIQFGPDATSMSEADGRWSCNMIPTNMARFSLLVTHPEHAHTTVPVQSDAPRAHVVVMKAGFTVAGTVQDSNGNPIDAAEVRDVRMNEEGERSTNTDPAGTFQLKHMNAGELVLAVKAQGFAPAVQTIQVTGALAGIRFHLGPGQLLRGRVIDEEGNPIRGVWAKTTPGRRKIQWSVMTDADGRFEWDSAPEEPLLYSFMADGFKQSYALKLQADGSDHEIKLTREQPGKDAIQISGTVVDANTGEPLDDFTVLLGEVSPDWPPSFQFATTGYKGRFTVTRSATFQRLTTDPESRKRWYSAIYQLQIKKDGYVPLLSQNIFARDGSQTIELKLQRGSGPSGVVLLPSGEPAANAMVLLCTPERGVTIHGPAQIEKDIYTTKLRAQTDQGGRFSLPPVADPQGLVVVHEQGYAQSPVGAATNEIALQPWGRVEGRLVLDSRPAANQHVCARHQVLRYDKAGRPFGLMNYFFETTTDSAGRFSFEKVPPGPCTVYRKVSHEPRTWFESHETTVSVNAGATTDVVLGSGGRTVIGRVTLPGVSDGIDWESVPVRLTLKTANDPGPRPKRDDFISQDIFVAATEYFFAASRAQLNYAAFCDSNGSFRIPDVPPGSYKLEIKAPALKRDSLAPADLGSGESASLVREITVPELDSDQSGEPLDLGMLQLVARQNNTGPE